MQVRNPAITSSTRKMFLGIEAALLLLSLSAQAGFDEDWFLFVNEFYGANSYTNQGVVLNGQQNVANAFEFHPPMSSGMEQLMANNNWSLILYMNGSSHAEGSTAAEIENQQAQLARFAQSPEASDIKVIWLPMAEWDQSGGNIWAYARPNYSGMTRQQAYEAFRNYYLGDAHAPLGTYLRQTPAERGVPITSVTDFPSNMAYAYEWGVDIGLCERSIDELSDISTGIAFMRGLSRQYDKPWGMDLSTWRTSNDAATSFNGQTLIGGWSPSYCRRHFYIAYMSGANVVLIEAVIYRDGTTLNPFGEMCREFGDFSLVRHQDVGRPVVTTALMLDFYNGFDPKHWIWTQGNSVWYQQIPYSDGDFMINNFLKIAYPEHWLHGLTPNASFNTQNGPDAGGFQAYLANGGDPRPYEPMGTTRYGDNLDIIYNNASYATLENYRIIALLGGVSIDDDMRPKLQQWVQAGGTLVVNVRNVTSADESLLGVTLSNITGTGTSARWISDETVLSEESFTYTTVTPTTATVLADNNERDALITSNTVGNGEVILSTPHYLQNNDKDTLLNIGVKLFDSLQARHAIAEISGPPVEYIVNRGEGKTVVTIVNNSGTVWNGSIKLDKPAGAYEVNEWRSDQAVSSSEVDDKLTISPSVPAYDIRIYATEYSTSIKPEQVRTQNVGKMEIIPGKNALEIKIPREITGTSKLFAYTIDGRLVGEWELKGSGIHSIHCHKKNRAGDSISEGMYLFQLMNGNIKAQNKVILINRNIK
jgi:hypothetical protein